MILNKLWRKELLIMLCKMRILFLCSQIFDGKWVEHKLFKHIFISASVIKKLGETDKRDSKKLDEIQKDGYLSWLEINPMIKGKTVTVMVREKKKAADDECEYTPLVDSQEEITTICNKISHEKDWHFWNDTKTHKLNGFKMCSEQGNKEYFVPMSTWFECVKIGIRIYDEF